MKKAILLVIITWAATTCTAATLRLAISNHTKNPVSCTAKLYFNTNAINDSNAANDSYEMKIENGTRREKYITFPTNNLQEEGYVEVSCINPPIHNLLSLREMGADSSKIHNIIEDVLFSTPYDVVYSTFSTCYLDGSTKSTVMIDIEKNKLSSMAVSNIIPIRGDTRNITSCVVQ